MTQYLWNVGGLIVGRPIFIKTTGIDEIERNLLKSGIPLVCTVCGEPKSSRARPVGMQPFDNREEAEAILENVMKVYCVSKDDCQLVSFENIEIVTKKKPGRPRKVEDN